MIFDVLVFFFFPFFLAALLYPACRKLGISWHYFLGLILLTSIVFLISANIYNLNRISGINFWGYAASFLGMAVISYIFLRKNRFFDITPAESFKFLTIPGKNLRLRDVVAYAIKLEQKGINFYSMLEEIADEGDVKTLCETLISEERAHIRYFQNILARWLPAPISSGVQLQLEQKANEAGIFDVKGLKGYNMREVFDLAIKMEEKSVEFYGEMEKSFPQAWKQFELRMIRNEELKHAANLRSIQQALKGI